MVHIVKTISIAVAMVVATLVTPILPTPTAAAADGCGGGWFKESNGQFERGWHTWDPVGYDQRAVMHHYGRVRFCTDDDRWNNDENRRVLVGYPAGGYPLQSYVIKTNGAGNWNSFCVRQIIRVHMSGIKTEDSWNISGSYGKRSPRVKVSYSAKYDRMTVRVKGARECGRNQKTLDPATSGIRVTADNESGEVKWVELTTKIRAAYNLNGDRLVRKHFFSERDYSDRT